MAASGNANWTNPIPLCLGWPLSRTRKQVLTGPISVKAFSKSFSVASKLMPRTKTVLLSVLTASICTDILAAAGSKFAVSNNHYNTFIDYLTAWILGKKRVIRVPDCNDSCNGISCMEGAVYSRVSTILSFPLQFRNSQLQVKNQELSNQIVIWSGIVGLTSRRYQEFENLFHRFSEVVNWGFQLLSTFRVAQEEGGWVRFAKFRAIQMQMASVDGNYLSKIHIASPFAPAIETPGIAEWPVQ